jgi:hypothetical protein
MLVLARALFVAAILPTVLLAQSTWYVDVQGTPPGTGTAADPYTSLQHAIAQPSTVDGDLVLVAPGLYVENLDFLGKEIVVRGSGAGQTIVDGSSTNPVVRFTSGEGPAAALEDLTLRRGRGENWTPGQWRGGGVLVLDASPTLRRLTVESCSASRGAGLCFEGSQSRVEDCLVRLNSYVSYGAPWPIGGGIWSSSPVTVLRTRFEQNRDCNQGGGAAGAGDYVECVFLGNGATQGGGAYTQAPGTLRFVRCEFANNFATSEGTATDGGGIYGPATAIECSIHGNSARQGGGAMGATLIRCALTGNRANSAKGAIGVGGGALNSTLEDCDVFANRAGSAPIGGSLGTAGYGGGLSGGTALRCRLRNNTSYFSGGGGAFNAKLIECEVSGNAIFDSNPALSPNRGGGVLGGRAVRCTITGNSAPRGGGAADAQLVHCTLEGNVAAQRGGSLAVTSGAREVLNSILRGGVPDAIHVYGGTLAVEYSDVEGGYAGTGNFDLDPSYADAAGGDYHLLANSPCIDAGNPGSPPDPDGTTADVGAFAFVPGWCGPVTTECEGKINSQGCIPQVDFEGYPSLSGPDAFVATASDVLNQRPGFLFWGRAAANLPFQGGTLCVAPPLQRTPLQIAGGTQLPAIDCSGSFSFAFSHAYMAAQGIFPGDTIHAQWFARDLFAPDGTNASLSNALRFTLCP